MSLKERLDSFAREQGIIYGIGTAQPFYEYRETLARAVPFVNYSVEERLDPSVTLAGAKSLIAIGLSYNNSYAAPANGELCAALSEGAVGEDYHLTVTRLLKELCTLLFSDTEYEYKYFCDTGPLSDSLVALRCSLGCSGLNHSVISPRFGSMFFIGYIISTAELEPTPKPPELCGGCGLCVKKCPSGALKADGSFDCTRCVAYLTQKKGIIEDEFKPFMGTYIYGCDICRRSCPQNPPKTPAEGCAYPHISDLLKMTNKSFDRQYGNTAIGWRGKRTIIRNALIALGNIGDVRALELLAPFKDSDSPELRDAALWSEKQIRGKNGILDNEGTARQHP